MNDVQAVIGAWARGDFGELSRAASAATAASVATMQRVAAWLEALKFERPDCFDGDGVLVADFAERLAVAPMVEVFPQVLPLPEGWAAVDEIDEMDVAALQRENARLRRKLDGVRDGLAVLVARVRDVRAG